MLLIQQVHTNPAPSRIQMFLVLLRICGATAAFHSLKYVFTGSSQVPNFPEFVSVGMVDDAQMIYYDSDTRRSELKQDWMKNVTADHPQYLRGETDYCLRLQQAFTANIKTAQQRFNHTGGVHIAQRIYGCDWDDETNEVTGYDRHGYDGKDFISFDLQTDTWIAPTPQAVITKNRWDNEKVHVMQWKNYLTRICPEWLKKYVNYGKSSLLRTVLPSVCLLQTSPSSPVSCHATGFYPDRATMFWRKDGEETHEDVDHGEILPNHDGTFQMTVDLKVKAEDLEKYECVFQLAGVKDDIITKLDKAEIRTNGQKSEVSGSSEFPVVGVSGAAVVVLPLSVCIIGCIIWRRRYHGE